MVRRRLRPRPAHGNFDPVYARRGTAEKLIALGRAVLALLSLAGVWADPATPARYQGITYTLMLVYAVYAVTVLTLAWSAPPPSSVRKVVSHVFDLSVFTIFIYLTEGPVSPFFLYFVFSLFCAALRFPWRGILLTAIASTGIYVAMGVYTSALIQDPLFDLHRFIIRTGYLIVVAALLVYLGAYHERLNTELAALAAWPRALAPSLEETLGTLLQSASRALRMPRILLLWEEEEEPWTWIAYWANGSLTVSRVPPSTFEPLTVPELRDHDFLHNQRVLRSASQFIDGEGVHEWRGTPVNADLRRQYDIETFVSLTLDGQGVTGRIFALSSREVTHDDLVLGRVVAKLIVAAIDQFFFLREVRHSASAEERFRISRDLHDGIIQSLGGVGLQLEGLRQIMAQDPDRARRQLADIQRVIESDQRELRAIVRELRPGEAAEWASALDLRLQTLSERFEFEWEVEVSLVTSGLEAVRGAAAMEVYRIINEALANAVRHGRASIIRVEVHARGGMAEIVVADNGKGFPFRGRYDLQKLESVGEGPRTLKERIASLGGSLEIESGSTGATIEARFPVSEELVSAAD
jgi:signal transduction histidine kinase